MADRDIDVVILGATSVTGRRTSQYLHQRAADTGQTWAAAARDPEKLDRILAEDGVTGATTIAADVTDDESLARLAERAKVVLNLVGPYTLHGRPVIAACIENGAHYVDLTGEMPFARRVIRDFDEAAKAARVKVVQVCGFEALPPDLGVALAAQTARERHDEDLTEAELEMRTLKMPPGMPRATDVLSGGTMQSLAEAVGDEDSAALTDPACLVFDEASAQEIRRVSPISVMPRRNSQGATIGPMAPAAFINPAIIQRSAALSDPPRPPLRYREGTALDGGLATLPLRLAAVAGLSATQAGAAAIANASDGMRGRASSFLRRALPGSGFGPAADRLEGWLWRMDVRGRTASGKVVHVGIEGDGHPGYLATSRMLGEAGLLLAEDSATPDRAGCLTPALALGTAEIGRFDKAGLRFSVSS